MSHELKTPLTSITGFAELMKEGMVPKEKMQEFSGDIYRESRRLIDLVDDIIQLSRLDEGTANFSKSPVDLYTLSGQVIESLRPVAQKQDITLTLSGQHAVIEGVEQLLQEMIYNLCDNAIKYNISGGSVTVSVWQNGQTVTLSVVDTGIGIPYARPEPRLRAFLPRRQEPLQGSRRHGSRPVHREARCAVPRRKARAQERPRPRHSHRRQLYCPGIIICSF